MITIKKNQLIKVHLINYIQKDNYTNGCEIKGGYATLSEVNKNENKKK